MKSRSQGFTVVELLFIITLVAVAALVFFNQKAALDAAQRDNQRKTAINAMYYGLEEDYYARQQSYPEHIDSKTLRTVDPSLFTDPNGLAFDVAQSSYHYEALNCNEGKCRGYVLRADMEKESEYRKPSRNN